MERQGKATVVLCFLAILGIATLTGCYEIVKFKERLKLSDAQVRRAEPLVNEYIQRQNDIFDGIQAAKAAYAHSGEGASAKLDLGEYKKKMEALRKESDQKFKDNDDSLLKALSAFLPAEQLAEFPKITDEIRQAKWNALQSTGASAGKGSGGHGGPRGGGSGHSMEDGMDSGRGGGLSGPNF